MFFIKLTEWKELKDIYINSEKILEMRPQKEGSTFLIYSEKIYTNVKETPREIMDIIQIEREKEKAVNRLF